MERTSLTITTPPTSYPITVEEVKAFAKIDSCDDDTLINSLIITATQSAEEFLRRALITQSLTLTLDLGCNNNSNLDRDGYFEASISLLYGDLPRTIELPKAPIQSVTSVTLYGIDNTSSIYSSSNYFLDTSGSRLCLNDNAIWTSNLRQKAACKILYVAGYGLAASIPQAIKSAILMYVQRMYDERIICDLPDTCKNILTQWRIYGETLR